MCDSSYEEDLDRYRRNNVELAVALNEIKGDLNSLQMELLQRNGELQRAHTENAALKQELMQKNQQLQAWRLLIMDLVQTNTQKYSEFVKKLGLTPAASSVAINRPNECPPRPPPMKIAENRMPPTPSQPIEENRSANIAQRRPKAGNAHDAFTSQLSDLTEESISSQLNESKSLDTTPEKNINRVVSRRRASVPPATPPLTVRQKSDRMSADEGINGKKTTAKVKKLDQIIDENTPINGSIGRPSRKTAPKNLSEPKLGTKLRRN